MSKVRDVLVRVSVEKAERKRRCHHKPGHSIAGGEYCLVVKGDLPGDRKNYCKECATPMLTSANGKVASLRAEMGI
jgi:hypothetical protein